MTDRKKTCADRNKILQEVTSNILDLTSQKETLKYSLMLSYSPSKQEQIRQIQKRLDEYERLRKQLENELKNSSEEQEE